MISRFALWLDAPGTWKIFLPVMFLLFGLGGLLFRWLVSLNIQPTPFAELAVIEKYSFYILLLLVFVGISIIYWKEGKKNS